MAKETVLREDRPDIAVELDLAVSPRHDGVECQQSDDAEDVDQRSRRPGRSPTQPSPTRGEGVRIKPSPLVGEGWVGGRSRSTRFSCWPVMLACWHIVGGSLDGLLRAFPFRDFRQRPAPVFDGGEDVAGDRASGGGPVSGEHRLDDGQVLAGLVVEPAPRQSGSRRGYTRRRGRPERGSSTGPARWQEGVAARGGDHVVEPAIDGAGLLDVRRPPATAAVPSTARYRRPGRGGRQGRPGRRHSGSPRTPGPGGPGRSRGRPVSVT